MILTPEILIEAYRTSYFPMADSADGEIYWYSPDPRCIIPLSKVTPITRSLRQSAKKQRFEYKINTSFEAVMKECANRDETWISEEIISSYCELNKYGNAHSVETWSNGNLVGGLYGVAIGGAFLGESMFSKVSDASKAAFYHLISILNNQGYLLLDSQFITDYTKQLGAIEIPRKTYLSLLQNAIEVQCDFRE